MYIYIYLYLAIWGIYIYIYLYLAIWGLIITNNNNNKSLGYVKFVIQFSKPIIWILLAFRGTLLYMSRVKEVSYFENVKGNTFDVLKVRLVSIMEINKFSSDCVDRCCFVFS